MHTNLQPNLEIQLSLTVRKTIIIYFLLFIFYFSQYQLWKTIGIEKVTVDLYKKMKEDNQTLRMRYLRLTDKVKKLDPHHAVDGDISDSKQREGKRGKEEKKDL